MFKTALNVATGGTYGAFRWLTRKKDGQQTFMGRVMALVMSHAIFSMLIGSVSLWGIFKGIGYLLAGILWLCFDWDVRPPANEQEKGRDFLARTADAVDERYDRLKVKLEAEAEKRRQEFEERKKEFEERELASQIARRKHEAEMEIDRQRHIVEEEASRRRVDLEARERELAAKTSAAIKDHTPSLVNMLPDTQFNRIMFGRKPDPEPIQVSAPERRAQTAQMPYSGLMP